MAENDNNRKRKSKRAVFENAMENNKTIKAILRQDDIDETSNSELCLIIDDDNEVVKKQRIRPVRLVKEILSLHCEWGNCTDNFNNYHKFIRHLKNHVENYSSSDDSFICYWKDCSHSALTLAHLNQHLCFHGYHMRLKNIGKNVEERSNLPKCTQNDQFTIPTVLNGYICEWVYCHQVFTTIYDFIEHMQVHTYSTPEHEKYGTIECLWKGCNSNKFSCQYKLRQHLRTHTSEKLVACPTCGNLFHTNTKFCDHRNRQLSTELLSYLCSQCSKRYPTERLLRDHMRSHINNYKCSMCDMTCPKPSILAKHFRYKHLNQKPYKCNICDFRGVSKHNLDVHLKKHDENDVKMCEKCDYQCRSDYGLEKHYHKAHGKEWTRIYECHNCKRKFNRGSSLTKHLMRKHNYHWPSGHSRFRYKKDQDNILRLQTVRYETLDVTEQIMKSKITNNKTPKNPKKSCNYSLKRQNSDSINEVPKFEVQEVKEENEKKIVITIDDLDSKGNVLKSRIIQSSEIICDDDVDKADEELEVEEEGLEDEDDLEDEEELDQDQEEEVDQYGGEELEEEEEGQDGEEELEEEEDEELEEEGQDSEEELEEQELEEEEQVEEEEEED